MHRAGYLRVRNDPITDVYLDKATGGLGLSQFRMLDDYAVRFVLRQWPLGISWPAWRDVIASRTSKTRLSIAAGCTAVTFLSRNRPRVDQRQMISRPVSANVRFQPIAVT